MNQIQLQGNLGRDPELRYTKNGKAVMTFSLATSEKQANGEYAPVWHKVLVWGAKAERLMDVLHKGVSAVIFGKLAYNKWTDQNGNNRVTAEIVGFDVHACRRPQSDGYAHDAPPVADEDYSQESGDEEDIPF
jgi:single-strand DNA-binding protein